MFVVQGCSGCYILDRPWLLLEFEIYEQLGAVQHLWQYVIIKVV